MVEATHRIDERALRHLIPIVKIETLRERCGPWFGVAFLARQIMCSGNMFDRLASFEVWNDRLDFLRKNCTPKNFKKVKFFGANQVFSSLFYANFPKQLVFGKMTYHGIKREMVFRNTDF